MRTTLTVGSKSMDEASGKEECVPLDVLIEMKISALRILGKIRSDDTQEAQDAMENYVALVDRFYQVNEHFMVSEQCMAAKQDAEYFIHLLDLAIHYSATSVQRV
jgi:hypothetical protein